MRHQTFAAAMGFAIVALFSTQPLAAARDPVGIWLKEDGTAKMEIKKCGRNQLCSSIVWLKDPNDSRGRPLRDARNERPSLRNRQIIGLPIFRGLTPVGRASWSGSIYNPEDGNTYKATLTLVSSRQIVLKGCKAFGLLCGQKVWTRSKLDSAPPQVEAAAEPEKPKVQTAAVVPAPVPTPSAKPAVEPKPAAEPAAAAVPESVPAPVAKPDVEPKPAAEPAAVAVPEPAASPSAAPAPQRKPTATAEAASSQPVPPPVAKPAPAPAPQATAQLDPAAQGEPGPALPQRNVRQANAATEPEATEEVPRVQPVVQRTVLQPDVPHPSQDASAGYGVIMTTAIPQPAPLFTSEKPSTMFAIMPSAAEPAATPAVADEEAVEQAALAPDDAAQTAESVPLPDHKPKVVPRPRPRTAAQRQRQRRPLLPWLR